MAFSSGGEAQLFVFEGYEHFFETSWSKLDVRWIKQIFRKVYNKFLSQRKRPNSHLCLVHVKCGSH